MIAIGAVAGCGYLYYQLKLLNQDIDSRTADQQAKIRSLDVSPKLAALSQQLDQSSSSSKQDDTKLANRIDQLQVSVEVLQENGSRADRDWIIAETRYLLKMAQHRLLLAGDLDTAAAATRAADAQLHSLADVSLLPVREALAAEIALLRSTPKPDIEGNVFSLIQLARRSNDLPLKSDSDNTTVPVEQIAEAESAVADDPSQQAAQQGGFSKSVMKFVDRFVLVKSVPVTEPSVLLQSDATESLSKRAALQVALQKAQIAVLRRDQNDYVAAVSSAKLLLADNFDANNEVVKRFSEDLAQLEQSPVQPQALGIGAALKLLNKIVTEQDVAS